eukprot:8709978-Lingulodinium_polyedra.AAC.1
MANAALVDRATNEELTDVERWNPTILTHAAARAGANKTNCVKQDGGTNTGPPSLRATPLPTRTSGHSSLWRTGWAP